MAYDFSKGSKTIRKVGFLDGVNGSKIRPVSPFPLESSKGLVAKYFDSTKESLSATRLLDQSPLNSGTRRTGEEGRCYTADGIDDEVNFGNIGSAIWFSGWVRLNSDNQCLFSLSNDTNTNLIVSAGVLTAGATLALTGIRVDDVSKNATEAGALLNDNAWHFLSCGIGDGLGGGSTADDVRFFTDGTNHGSVSGFDWRFWSNAPTAAELTEAHSGDSPNRNSAALSKYALWAKCDEQSGTTAYDSSGKGLTGTLTNITAGTFHSTQDIWSFQNQVGFNKRMYFDGVNDYVNFGSVGNLGVNCRVQLDFITKDSAQVLFSQRDANRSCLLYQLAGSNSIAFYNNNGNVAIWTGTPNGINIRDGNKHTLLFEKNGNDLSITIDGYTMSATKAFADSGNTGDFAVGGHPNELSEFEGLISNVKVDAGNTGVWDLESNGYGNTDADWIDTTGNGNDGTVNGSPSNILLPRDESDPTNDVLGNPLANTGRRPNDAALHSSNCLTADGTLYIAAAHLAGTETVVSSGGTSTPSISAGRIDFTAGTCWDLTLSDGTHYPLSEGNGIGIHDDSGSGNHGILTNAVLANAWGGSQDSYNKNLIDGFVYAYQPAKQVFTGAQAANITGISFKFRSTDPALAIFNDGDASPFLLLYAVGGPTTFYTDSGNISVSIDGDFEWGSTRQELVVALADGNVHDVVISNITFANDWLINGIYLNSFTSLNFDSTTYLWDLAATDSNGDPIIPSDPDVYLPRDESDPTNDVLGNLLTNTGRRPNDAALHSSNCLTADGTLYIVAAHLVGTETVVSSGGTSTPSISAGRINFTAGTCWDLTLSDGTHYPLSEGGGIGIHDDSGAENHGILTNAVLANAWGGSQDSYHSNLSDGFVYAYQPAKQVFTGAQAANITGISFKFRSTDTNLIIFSDNTPSLYLIYCYIGSAATAWTNGMSGMTLAIDGSTESGTTLGDLYNALCDGGIHEVVLTNLSFASSWVTDGIFVNRYTGTQQWNSTTYLWDLVATDSNGDPIYPADPDVRLPAVTSSLGPYSIPLTDLPSDPYHNRAETLIDFDPDSTPEMNNIYLESVFNGSTSNGYVTNDSILNFTDNLTVSCWAKSDLTDITSSADTLVSMYESTGNLQVWRMEISTDEKLRFQVGNSGGNGTTIETADSSYPIDTWTHYAATFDGGVVKLYVNGELQSSSESSAHATSLNGRSAPLVLGAYYWSGGGGSFQEWDGALRNIRVYKGDSSPLSNSQIVRDMIETASQPRFEGQTVIASYDLVKDTLDRSGNSLNAQNNNISFTKKTVPASLDLGADLGEDGIVQKTVKFDSGEWGAVFDGSSYAIVKNREKLKIKEKPFSIECSVKTTDTGSNTILSKYQTSGNLRSYSLNIESGKIVFHSSSNGTAVVSSTGSDTINDGSWHKIKVVRESESGTSLKMYVDDVEDTGVGGSLASNFSENISNVAIGAYNTDATAANVFTGNIRELKVFTDDNIERASWELAKDTRDSSSNNYHGENNGITFLTPKQEYGYSISDSTPLAKQDQYLKEYHKSRLYL